MNLLTVSPTAAIASAKVTEWVKLNGQPRNLTAQFNFVYGSGGTSFDAYLQVSLDGGATATDVANFHATTSSLRKAINLNAQTPETTQVALTDGSMTANAAQDGILSPMMRVKYQSSGTYAATTVTLDVQSDQDPGLMADIRTKLAIGSAGHAWPEPAEASLEDMMGGKNAPDARRMLGLPESPSEPGGIGRAIAVAGAATIDAPAGTVTTEPLDNVAGYTLTLRNRSIRETSMVMAGAQTSDHAHFAIVRGKSPPGDGEITISVMILPSLFRGTIDIDFAVFN